MDMFDLDSIWDISPVTAVSALLIIILGVLYYLDVGVPPGPRGLPFFGFWPFLNNDTAHLELQELMKTYGDVYSFKITGHLLIHLGSIKALKEALVNKADCFSDRYSNFSVLTSIFDEGVVCLNGEPWKVVRKFFLQAFREFGIISTKDFMTGPIYDSMAATVDSLKAEEGKPVNVISILTIRCSAILRRMLFNDDGIADEELKEIIDAYGKVLSIFRGTRILLHGEFARRIIFPLMPDYKIAIANHKIMVSALEKIIQRHEETFNEDSVRDMIDAYIKERNERRSKNDPTSEYFTEKVLVSSLIQILGDGILSLSFFASYFLYALLEHPEEQDKLQKELDDVIGSERHPTIEDKNKLPYMNAFMQEVLRTTDFLTIFPSLKCTKETTLNGFKVPVGAITVINYWSCNMDPAVFKDPDEFRPMRYIPEPGQQKEELPITFGVGKRACAGEAFTMMQTFLFLSTVVQNFRLERPEGLDKKTFMEGNMEIIVHPRKSNTS